MSAIHLAGMTWNHPRGLDPLLASSAAFSLEHPEISIHWDARSLQDFADFPLSELAERYDLLVFDHPFVGEVAASQLLVPLDDVLPEAFIVDQAASAVGESHNSYRWNGILWGLAVDAACQVSACRPDLLDEPPRHWNEVLALARAQTASGGPLVAVPARPIDSFLAFVSLMANEVVEPFAKDGTVSSPDRAVEALEFLAELLSLSHHLSM
ncbi:MAG: multiple sugar transport system substrate-binding protein [Mycobacterium sp.]|nr:multiple sugar transport system substrate-binding protein [Mycobacterium sp.]